MFYTNNFGLVILSLGVLALIVSFLVTDRRKYLISLALAALVVLTGVYQTSSQWFRAWSTNRRIAQLQKQQRVNLESLQERLRQAPAAAPAVNSSAPAPAPAQPAASTDKRRRR